MMRKVLSIAIGFLIVVLCIFLSGDFGMGQNPKKSSNDRRLSKVTLFDLNTFDANRIFNYLENDGTIVTDDNPVGVGTEWPKGSGRHINYASGLWLGGVVGNDTVTAAAEYVSEFVPGAVTFDPATPTTPGTPKDKNDQTQQIYKINKSDLANPLGNTDYVNWPAAEGAPTNADGTPLLIGDQTIWYACNDFDAGAHANLFGSGTMGVELQTTIWGYNRPDAFGDMMFVKFLVVNKGGKTINNTFASVWADIDLGDANDDYVGCDTTLGLGFNWNEGDDGDYGVAAPAIGYDFFQGPIIPGAATDTAKAFGRRVPGKKNLKMTSFSKYIRGGGNDFGDPETAIEAYSYMNGLNRVGQPIIDPTTNQPSKFAHPGDPVTGTGWLDPVSHPAADRRFLMTAGPFTMAPGDSQEIVIGMLIAQGSNEKESVALLKRNDALAQLAYDIDFKLPPSPPGPKVNVASLPGEIILTWDESADDYEANDLVDLDSLGNATKYTFQGYNVYQVNAENLGTNVVTKRIASFDIIDGITNIRDVVFDATRGENVEVTVQKGSDGGLQRYLHITTDAFNADAPLSNWRRYYFAVTAYGYNPFGIPKILETTPTPFTVMPGSQALPGTQYTAALGDSIAVSRVAGPSDGSAVALVVDPSRVSGDQYEVRFRSPASGTVYDIWNTTKNARVDSNRTNQSDAEGATNYAIIDGVMVKVFGAPPDFKNFLTVANAAGALNPPEAGAFGFNASGFPLPTTGDRPDGSRQQSTGGLSASQGWGIHTGDTVPPSRSAYTAFTSRVTRDGARWSRIIPYDYEIRFTAAGSVGIYPLDFSGAASHVLLNLPFELWRIGVNTPDDPSDDVRMIPYILDANENGVFDLSGVDHAISGGDNDPETDWIYWLLPTNATPGDAGYQAFANAVTSDLAGYSFEQDGARVMERMVLVLWNGGSVSDANFPANVTQALPETGTVFRIVSTKPNTPADVFTFNTSTYKPKTNDAALAKQEVEKINVFPNPYFGQNLEERDPLNRFVTFTHLPAEAKIRIFTLAGDVVRTIEHTNGLTYERWDLRNQDGIPVASGMYLIHIDLGPLGEKILKAAVMIPEERLDVF
jgi:hypothetical protein